MTDPGEAGKGAGGIALDLDLGGGNGDAADQGFERY